MHAAVLCRTSAPKLVLRRRQRGVPNYSRENRGLGSFFHSFMANDEFEPYFHLNGRGLLEIRGCFVDEIVAHCPCDAQCRRMDLVDERKLEYHCRWRKFFQMPEIPDDQTSASTDYVTASSLEYAYWATLCRGHCIDWDTKQPLWLDEETVDACKIWLRNLLQTPQLPIPPSVQRHVYIDHESVSVMDATHLFRTRFGFIGVTHRSTPLRVGIISSSLQECLVHVSYVRPFRPIRI